jgi:Zn-dependent oligopeptidase
LKKLKDGQKLYPYDLSFYNNIRMKTQFNVDHEKIKEYFPLDFVLTGVLDCYSKLLSVTFQRDTEAEAASWHSDVRAYTMYDKADSRPLARFYLDLHPRTGKYTHAACWWLQKKGQAEGSMPTVCMVTNFTSPTADRPALLRFSEVETLFHEFGHVCHACLSQNQFQRLNWTWKAVEMDVLEVDILFFRLKSNHPLRFPACVLKSLSLTSRFCKDSLATTRRARRYPRPFGWISFALETPMMADLGRD